MISRDLRWMEIFNKVSKDLSYAGRVRRIMQQHFNEIDVPRLRDRVFELPGPLVWYAHSNFMHISVCLAEMTRFYSEDARVMINVVNLAK